MASFTQGTAEEVKSGAAQFRPGAIVSKKAMTPVGVEYREVKQNIRGSKTRTVKKPVGGTKIYHRAVTYVTQNEDGTVSGAERVIYIEKNGTYQPAAISKDGGKTYSFSDPNYPTMDGVAGTGLQNELNNKDGGIRKNLDAQINNSLDDAGIPKTQKKEIIDSIKNNADQKDEEKSTDDGSDEKNKSTDSSTPSESLTSKSQEREGTRSSFGNLVYPLDLGITGQDVLKFSMLKYVPSDVGGTSDTFSGINTRTRNEGFSNGSRDILGTVILPIPGGIQDSNSVNWSSQNMNALQAELANLALSGVTGGADGFFGGISDIAGAIQKNNSELGSAAAAAFAGQASGVGGQLITRTTGAIVNPNMELLFSGPALRQFSFKFMLTPREKRESEEIVKVLRFFKQGSAVQRTKSNLFLKSPHTFKIQYLHRGPGDNNDNPFMNKVKECACTGVNVNYTPQNNYSTFTDGAMTSYELTLNFNELEPIFNDNYADDGDTTIGF